MPFGAEASDFSLSAARDRYLGAEQEPTREVLAEVGLDDSERARLRAARAGLRGLPAVAASAGLDVHSVWTSGARRFALVSAEPTRTRQRRTGAG